MEECGKILMIYFKPGNCYLISLIPDDPAIQELMRMWGCEVHRRWPIGVIWFATYLVHLGTSYGTKKTYRSAINAFNAIYACLSIPSPLSGKRVYPRRQIDVFMALATMASYKAASTCRGAKSAAEDAWLLNGNKGPVIDQRLWKRMYKGIEVYKGKTLADKSAILPSQVRKKIDYMVKRGEHFSIDGASIILAELCGVLLGLRRSEHFASAMRKPNRTTLLCFRNLAGAGWDLGDMTRGHDIKTWADSLSLDEIIKVRLCYTKHQRHRVAHEVIAGPGHKLMSFVLWLKVVVKLRAKLSEPLTVDSPLLVRSNKGSLVPMTGDYMSKMDSVYARTLGWCGATIHSRRRGFATAAVRSGIHMATITIAMRHSQGVTMQYITLSTAEKATITTRLAIDAYRDNEVSVATI